MWSMCVEVNVLLDVCLCSNHDDGKLSWGTCMTFCYTLWTRRAFSQRCGKRVTVQTQFLKIRQGKKTDLGIPPQMHLLSRQGETKVKNKIDIYTQRNILGSLTQNKICILAMGTTKTQCCFNMKVQCGSRCWKAAPVLCVVMVYHLSYERKQSSAAVAVLTQLWTAVDEAVRPVLALITKSAENCWLSLSLGKISIQLNSSTTGQSWRYSAM